MSLLVAVVGPHIAVWPAYLDTEPSVMRWKSTNCNRAAQTTLFYSNILLMFSFKIQKEKDKAFLFSPLDAAWSPRSEFSSSPLPGFVFGHLSAAQPLLRTPVGGTKKKLSKKLK